MIANFNIDQFAKNLEENVAEDILTVLGAQSVTWASEYLERGYSPSRKYGTQNLENSITFSTSKVQSPVKGKTSGTTLDSADKLTVRIGSNVIYAAIHEFGGLISANKAGALTIPISDEAKELSANGGRARNMQGLVLIHPRESNNAFLVRMTGKNTFVIHYLLVKSVEQQARPYLRPVIENHKQQILDIVQKAING